MIGKAYVSVFPFYDMNLKQMRFKKRPVLIIGQADSKDYVVLPISRVTNQNHIDNYYDIKLEPADFPLMNLTQKSFVRTHKQMVINLGELVKEILDFRLEYEEVYLTILTRVEEFQKTLITNAM